MNEEMKVLQEAVDFEAYSQNLRVKSRLKQRNFSRNSMNIK